MNKFWERVKNFYIGERRYTGPLRREYERATLVTNVARTRVALIVVLIVQLVNLISDAVAPSHLPSSMVFYNFGTWFLIISSIVSSILLTMFKTDKENTYLFRKTIVIASWVLLMAGSVFYCYGEFIERQALTNFTLYLFALGIVPVFGGIELTVLMLTYVAANMVLCVSAENAGLYLRQMLAIAFMASYCSAIQYTDGMRVFDDRKKLSEANRKLETLADSALVEAKEANAEKQDFLSRMSHDMRTPLAGIIGLIDLTIDEEMPDNVRDSLVKMDDASRYLLDLINYTLDLNEAENSRVTLYCETVEGDEFIGSVLTPYLSIMEDRGITFTLLPEERASMFLRLDKVRVAQIFSNILDNAIKFTPRGGNIVATIEYPELNEKRVTLKITVTDSGIGMSEEFIPKIFDAFAKEPNSLADDSSGAGLGMSIVKSLVELIDGKIEVYSKLGEGTSVTVTFTVDRAYQHGDDHRLAGMSPGEMLLRGKRILLVEDHPLNLEIAKRMLERRECIVECATDGKQGLDMFSSAPAGYYDGIVMDIRMPIMDGLTAARAIRGLHRADAATIPIIAMTANAFEEDVKKSIEAGMNEHLSKPIEPTQLYRTLAEHLSMAKPL